MEQCVLRVTALLMLLAVCDVSVMAQTLTQRLKTESIDKLATDAREQGNAVRGAIVFTQKNLNCTTCHAAGVAKPVGPNLKGLGSDATDVYLVEALLEPSKAIKKGFDSVLVVTIDGKTLPGRIIDENPDEVVLQVSSGDLPRVTLARSDIDEIAPSKVSAMPENLIDQLANREQFLDLVRYLMELAAAEPDGATPTHVAGGQSIEPELQGIVLLKEFNCSACHLDDVTQTQLTAKQPPDLRRSIGRINPHFVRQFVADPLDTRPRTTMPDVMSGMSDEDRQTVAEQITHYLASLGDTQSTASQSTASQSTASQSTESQSTAPQPVDATAATRGGELFHTVGCAACHSPRDENHREVLAESSDPLGDVHHKYNLDGLVAFLENPLEVRPSGRMPKLQLTHWEAVDVASYLLSHPQAEVTSKPWELDQELVAKGKVHFDQLGCRQCHQVDSAVAKPSSLPLSQVRVEQGCLSGSTGKWPTFSLTESQRQAIQAALGRESHELSGGDAIAVTLTAFRCLSCHQRDDLGGVSDQRDAYFQTTNPNLGPQGRIPPTLTGIGAKLNPKWMQSVLAGQRTIRPYVLTRMPQFGTENVEHLVDLCQQTDRLPSVDFAKFDDQKMMRETGAEMVGTGGLNCIVCHTFQQQQAANMPAVDLTEMAERLKKDWFYRYMQDPQSLSPNTIMPSFWPGGRAMRTDILDGDRNQQIEALWQYLLDGRQARTPRGLIVEPLELLATDEAVMLRRSYPGVGKRGIGVGLPGEVNLVFDAEQMRLALIWKGKFADPASVWRGQGSGTVRPLGEGLLQFAAGPDLDDATNPWIADDGRPPRHHFKGYSLDDQMRPRFRYEFDGVNVDDYAVDVLDALTGNPFIRRTVTLKADSDRDGLSFRVATGKSIVRGDDGVYVVDNRLRIHIDEAHAGSIVDVADGKSLLIPLSITGGATPLTLEYKW